MRHDNNTPEYQLAMVLHTHQRGRVADRIERGADLNAAVAILGWPAYAPLARAAMHGWDDVCRLLLKAGALVNARDEHGTTALHHAAPSANEATLAILLEHGADINAVDNIGYSVLHSAARDVIPGRSAYLIRCGATALTRISGGETPLHSAASANKVDACRCLVDAGLAMNDVPEKASQSYLTPFQRAVDAGAVDVVRFAIEELGEDLGQKTVDGRSLFDMAVDAAGNANKSMSVLLSIQTARALEATLPSSAPAGPGRALGIPAL
jgi:ankyrin repeat protein